MDLIKLKSWSYQRQRLGKAGQSATGVLKDIIGVYSAHPSGPLSLFARVKSLTPAEFYELESKREALRMPAMRLSVYMLPAATAMKCLSATVPPPGDPYWLKRYGRIREKDFKAWRNKIIKLIAKPMTPDEIREIVNIPDEKVKGAAVAKLVFNRMAYEGSLLRVGTENLRSGKLLYVAAKQWVKSRFERIDSEKALIWLAGEYLRAFGPVRIKDFQWWAGVTATKAEAALAAVKTVEVGEGLLLQAKDAAAYDKFKARAVNQIDILPPWDSYPMGYAPDGRQRLVAPDMQAKVYGKVGATGGNALGMILINGLARGIWKSRFVKGVMKIETEMFEKPSAKARDVISAEFASVAAFLGAQKAQIVKF